VTAPLQGCQVRRESQEKLSLCCDGITALYNESHHELVIDVPLPGENATKAQWRKLDKLLDDMEECVSHALKAGK